MFVDYLVNIKLMLRLILRINEALLIWANTKHANEFQSHSTKCFILDFYLLMINVGLIYDNIKTENQQLTKSFNKSMENVQNSIFI